MFNFPYKNLGVDKMKYPKEFDDMKDCLIVEVLEAYGAQIAWRSFEVE